MGLTIFHISFFFVERDFVPLCFKEILMLIFDRVWEGAPFLEGVTI